MIILYPLSFAKERINLVIKEIHGSERNKNQCLAQGFCPGTAIKILQIVDCNLRVETQSSCYIIGKALAQYIFVEEENDEIKGGLA